MILFLKRINHAILPLLLLLIWTACKDDLVIDNSDQQFPLTMQVVPGNDKVTLQWDAANVSNFEKYVLVRSISPIPTGLRPTFNTPDFVVIFQSEDVETTSFVDEALPIVEKLYYKLYVSFGDRFVESEATGIPFDNLLISGNGAVTRVIPDSNWVLLGDEFSGTLRVVDYTTKEVKGQANVPFANADNMCLDIAVENGKQVLYWWAGYNNFYKFSLPELTQLNFWPVPYAGFSLLLGKDSQVFTTQYDYIQSFTPRRNSDMSAIQAHYRNDYYTHRTLLMLNENTNRMLEASAYRLAVFTVEPISGDVSILAETNNGSFSVFFRDMPVSQNRQYFIPRYDGIVYDQNLTIVNTIPFQNNGFADIDFSLDGQFVYATYQDFSFGGTLIQKFKFPSMELIATRRLTNVSPRSVAVLSDGLLFVGNGVNGLNQVLVKKIDL